ncbi:MAG TPA: DEAD/DEAH box helicase, partial [Elusimicrobiota bacterium]|nr:DEAD/DEAH box helicase [Elusimicrobiota bacterium]
MESSPEPAPERPPEPAPTFESLALAPELLQAIQSMGFERPTPIQARSVPPALTGADVLGSAQTGSGKTVAFALPLLQRLLSGGARSPGRPRALVLVPTRELAAQVEETVSTLSSKSPVRCALVIGGASWNNQVSALKGAEVVVATPGRLLDHAQNNRGFRLDGCSFLVLDEADRMLDMGFLPDIRAILQR